MSYLNRLNSLLTSTTSRYDSLRRNILSSSSEDDSSITSPDSTHVTRVLRAYYTEKARPFPAWLGPDPRSPLQTTQTPHTQTSRPVGSLRRDTSRGAGGGLGEIWNDGGGAGGGIGGAGQGQGGVDERGSLRRGLPGVRRLGGGGGGGSGGEGGVSGSGSGVGGEGGVRPLPSQRAGSYQVGGGVQGERMGGSGAAERLKARLNRGGSGTGTGAGGSGQGGGGGGGGGSYATQGLSGSQGSQGRR